MKISDLTFVVFTFNEAARLPRVIRNFQDYGPLLVVDNYSTDETVAIARAHGCDVLMNKNSGWVEDYETTERVKSAVRTNWLYWSFADEIAPGDVLGEIGRVMAQDRHDVIMIMRKNYFHGQFCRDVAASYQTKVFKKDAIDFQGNTIHHFGRVRVPDSRVYQMHPDRFIHHLISNTVASYVTTLNNYTDVEAAGEKNGARAPGGLGLLLPGFKTLANAIIRRGGYKGGRAAVSLSLLMAFNSTIKAMKIYESSAHLDRFRIEQENERVAQNLLKQLS